MRRIELLEAGQGGVALPGQLCAHLFARPVAGVGRKARVVARCVQRREHAKELFVAVQDDVPCLLARSGASHKEARQQEAQADFGFWIL